MAEAEKKLVAELPKTLGDPTMGAPSWSRQLAEIHFSWFGPLFRNMPQREIRLMLSCLSLEQAAELNKSLRFMNGHAPISPLGLSFLQETLWKKLTGDVADLLPRPLLPQTPLSVLLDLKTADLHALIDFLGLHDISVELKQIIDTSRLKKIYAALSANEQNYLRVLMQSREPVTFTPIGIANWQGDGAALKALVRSRGVNRLAKALYGQDPSFLWHVVHKMEIERALNLQKMCAPMENLTASKVLISQILELISFMRNPHE